MIPAVLALLAAMAGTPALAQAASQFPVRSSLQRPMLQEVVRRGAIRLGVADDAPPFAFTGLDGQPAGYAVEACRDVAAAVASELGLVLRDRRGGDAVPHGLVLDVVRLPVAAEADAVKEGTVDLGCSGVPVDAPGLSASPALAWSGTRVLAPRLGPVSSVRDLAGRTVTVVAGTRDAAAMLRIGATLSPLPHVRAVPSPGDAFELVATGGADAMAGDDLLLAGLLATRTDGPSLRIVGDVLADGPVVLLYRSGDPGLAALVERTVARLRSDGTLRDRYLRWFTTPMPNGAVPNGAALDRPPSPATDALLGTARP